VQTRKVRTVPTPLSPLLANIALQGLEGHIKKSFPGSKTLIHGGKRQRVEWKPQVIRYADDFVRHEARYMPGV
jgi:hypothetical protein